jgi:hypothetical protein
MLKHLPLALLGLTLATSAPAQQKLTLSQPSAEYAEPFTNLRAIRELPDGRVLTADVTDKVVKIVDLRTGGAVAVGREGQGPEEYLLPMNLFGTSEGGALLQDMGNRRFLPIGVDGKIGKSVSPPNPPPPANSSNGDRPRMMMMAGGLFDARAADGQGNLYFQGMALSVEGEGADSVPIMRWHPAKTTVDTVAWLAITADMRPRVQRDAGRTTVTVRMGGGSAWAKQTQWIAAPDGRIAILTPEPYQLTWLKGSTRSAGPVIPFAPVKVTDAEKKDYVARMARTRPTVMTFGGGRGGPPPRIDPPRLDEIDFPETMPAFSGRDAVLITPEGEVWVSRLRAASDKTPRYDVFDQKGQRIGEVTLRPESRVVGFGRGTVYVVRSDEDDLQYLERYTRPAKLGQ